MAFILHHLIRPFTLSCTRRSESNVFFPAAILLLQDKSHHFSFRGMFSKHSLRRKNQPEEQSPIRAQSQLASISNYSWKTNHNLTSSYACNLVLTFSGLSSSLCINGSPVSSSSPLTFGGLYEYEYTRPEVG